MSYDSRIIANELLDLAEKRNIQLTPMHILKLVYLAHGWKLAISGEPLLNEKVEAWQYGPVIPAVYESFKKYGKGVIKERAEIQSEESLEKKQSSQSKSQQSTGLQSSDRVLLEKILDVYGGYEAFQLSGMTHKQGTPWSEVWSAQTAAGREAQISQGPVIPNEMIRAHFLELVS